MKYKVVAETSRSLSRIAFPEHSCASQALPQHQKNGREVTVDGNRLYGDANNRAINPSGYRALVNKL
jgi:hypothetical protein